MDAIATVALLEETDQLLGKNHLFKRSLLLIKVISPRRYPVVIHLNRFSWGWCCEPTQEGRTCGMELDPRAKEKGLLAS